MEILMQYQVHILIGCGISCILLAIFSAVIKFHSIRKKLALIKIETGVAILLIADALVYAFEGNVSKTAVTGLRLAEFFVFIFTLMNLYFLCEYVTALFMESGRFKKLPLRLLLGFILPSIGASFVFISQFTHWYYYIDEQNIYHRGPLYFVSFLFPFVTIIIMFSFVMQYRKMLNKRILWSVILFSMLPPVAAVIQLFVYGVNFINLATWMGAIAMFAFALSDQNDELNKAASTDMQTGLPNTFGYIYELEHIIHFHDITQYNAYYFDIVRMNQINNKYGKEAGDEVIIRYAHKVKASVEKDEIVGRLGGNFFVALIKKENTEKFLELLRDVPVEIEHQGRSKTVHIAAVAGVYDIRTKNIAGGRILGYTSNAINYAKYTVHKPYVFLDDKLEQEFKHVQQVEENARKALLAEEFLPYYQPKVDSETYELSGAEALVRWKKDGKLIPPFEFVPIMERNGSICDLDFYVLEHVCMDIRDWIERGIEPVTVSVNFSRKNLGNPILAEAISKTVEKYDIPKQYIQIEITETIDEFPMDYLVGVIDALHRYGLTAAIDDFGTGSSSIGLLKSVDFDVLKIDKAFVNYTEEKHRKLLSDIIGMAKDLGIHLIAEGVEEAEQVHDLNSMGCYQIQGYIFDKPLEHDVFEERLKNRKYSLS